MKKTVLAFLICAFMFSVVAQASGITLTPTVTTDSVSAVINCGVDAAGKTITIEVFEPESGFDDLSTDGGETYTQTSPEKVDMAISFLYQAKADADGNVSFTYKPKGPKGRYYYRIAVAGSRTKTEGYFEFMSDGDAQAIIDKLKEDEADASDIEAVFNKSDSPNVYNSYQILEVDKSELFEYFDTLDPEEKDTIYTAMAARLDDIDDAEDFVNVFAEISYAQIIDLKTGSELLGFIDTLKEYSGIDECKEYTNIRQVKKYFDSEVEADFILNMEQKPLKEKTVGQITAITAEQLLTSALSKCSTYGILNSLIRDFEAEITDKGGKIDEYVGNETPLNIARKLMEKRPFDDVSDFASELNMVIASLNKKDDDEENRKPSSVGGSYTVSGTVNKEVTTQDLNTPVSSVTSEKAFSDLDGYQWAEEAISYMKSQGIINGIGGGLFAPASKVKREEFAKMIVLAFDIPLADVDTQFDDVKQGEWYAQYVSSATDNAIVNGTGDGMFGIGKNITREDMAVMCYRAVQKFGVKLEVKRGEPNFADSISEYAAEAVNALYSAEIINGTGENLFGAKNGATRAEAAKLLYEILKNRSGTSE